MFGSKTKAGKIASNSCVHAVGFLQAANLLPLLGGKVVGQDSGVNPGEKKSGTIRKRRCPNASHSLGKGRCFDPRGCPWQQDFCLCKSVAALLVVGAYQIHEIIKMQPLPSQRGLSFPRPPGGQACQWGQRKTRKRAQTFLADNGKTLLH